MQENVANAERGGQPEDTEGPLPRIHRRNDDMGRNVVGLAWVTLAIVLVFMICHSIKWIPNFYELVKVCMFHRRTHYLTYETI